MVRFLKILSREKKKRDKIVYCPVCHLELSLHDLDEDDYMVCPVCSVILEVPVINGFPLPVVHDIEIKRDIPKKRIHGLATHLSIGLLPVAILFNFIAIVMGLFNSSEFYFLDKQMSADLGKYLFIISFIGIIINFISGYIDWSVRYRKRPYGLIRAKIKGSIALTILGIAVIAMSSCGCLPIAGFAIQLVMFGIIGYIGHKGGYLVFGR